MSLVEFTIAQDQETSVIYGMPRVAAEIGAAKYILPIEMIAESINRLSESPAGQIDDYLKNPSLTRTK